MTLRVEDCGKNVRRYSDFSVGVTKNAGCRLPLQGYEQQRSNSYNIEISPNVTQQLQLIFDGQKMSPAARPRKRLMLSSFNNVATCCNTEPVIVNDNCIK